MATKKTAVVESTTEDKPISITFKCSAEMKRAVAILAAHDDLDTSKFIVKILAEVIEVNGEILGNMAARPKSPLESVKGMCLARKKKSAEDDSTTEAPKGGEGL